MRNGLRKEVKTVILLFKDEAVLLDEELDRFFNSEGHLATRDAVQTRFPTIYDLLSVIPDSDDMEPVDD